jgi:hypothetical protein
MSRHTMGATMMTMALLAGCADAGDAPQSGAEEGFEADDVERADAHSDETAVSHAALSAPSFALVSQQSGKAMTGGSLSAGTLVTQTNLLGSKGGPNQRWVSINQSITPESKPSLCLEANSDSSGAQLRLQPCNGGPRQGWRLELKLQNGVKLTRWKNLPSGLYLDNSGGNSEGAPMLVRPFNGLASQLFSRLF